MELIRLRELPGKIKRRVWNKRILIWWYRLWIREDKFHASLSIDPAATMEMSWEERERYISNLEQRRKIAHERS